MTVYELAYSFRNDNKAAIECPDAEVLLIGPAETGKTLALLWKLNAIALKYNNASIVLARKTLTSTYSTVLRTFQEKVLGALFGDDEHVPPYGGDKRPDRFIYPNGSTIWVTGMDKSSRVLSAEHDLIYVNQCEELTLDDWETLTTRTTGRAGHVRYPQTIGDANPTYPTHWMYAREDITRFFSWHKDNPALWDGEDWTAQGKRTMDRLSSLSGVRYLRLFKGQAAQAEGVIYDEYNEAVHLIYEQDAPKRFKRYVAGQDWGYSNAGYLGVWGCDYDDRMCLVAQICRTHETDDWWRERALELHEEYNLETIQCGAEQPAYIAKYQAAGLPAESAYTGVLPGITATQQRFKSNRMHITRDCVRYPDETLTDAHKPASLEQEIPGYVWANKKAKDTPVKENDHGCDGMRYAVCYVDNVSDKPKQEVRSWRPGRR